MIEAVLLEIIYLLLFGLVIETIIVFALIILVIILSKQTIKKHICNLPSSVCFFTYQFGKPRLWISIFYFYYTQIIQKSQFFYKSFSLLIDFISICSISLNRNIFGATNQDRTGDLYLTKVALYLLSYSSVYYF